MQRGEIVAVVVGAGVGRAICLSAKWLAAQEKRLFAVVTPFPVWFVMLRYCLFGVSIALFGIIRRADIARAFLVQSACPDRNSDLFALGVGLILLVGGLAGYRYRRRQNLADAAHRSPHSHPRPRPQPAYARVVKLPPSEQYPQKQPPEASLALALGGCPLILIGVLGLTGTFCVSTLVR